jgi:DNA recombination protein RmuC
MNETEIQLLIQLGIASLAGAAIGILLGAVFRLRRTGQLQQALDNAQKQLAELDETRESLVQERNALRKTGQAAEIRIGRLETEITGKTSAAEEQRQTFQRLQDEMQGLSRRHETLLAQHTELDTQLTERGRQHEEQVRLLNENRDNLKREFENLANKIFEDKGKSFTSTSKESLESMLKPFREQIAGFQTRINEVHSESLKGNTSLESEIKKVLEIGLQMNDQASNLTSALKGDKKTTGNWGEAQLERTLELAGLQSGDHYEAQAAFKDEEGKRKLPDFVIKLPDGKNLVVDSKVSLVDYDRAIGAETDAARTEALNAHAQAVRNHIDDLAGKDYSNLPNLGSPDFVLMFMPIEPAYIEAMKHNRELFNYGYNKGVVMVSHTTLMPILRTVANLWMVERSNNEAREISTKAGDIYNQVCTVTERLQRLGDTLKAASNHYNNTVTGLVGKQGLHGKVERFQRLSAKANKDLPNIEPVHLDLESDRLTLVIDKDKEPPAQALEEPSKKT